MTLVRDRSPLMDPLNSRYRHNYHKEVQVHADGGPEKLFTFGKTRSLGSPTPQEVAVVPSDRPLWSVTLWDLEGGETLYKIKRHAKIGEIFTGHANLRSTAPGALVGES